MGNFMGAVEESSRGTTPGTGLKFPPLTGKIEPDPEYKDEARDEYRGQDNRLGNMTSVRKSTAWKFSMNSALYPIDIIGTLFKHALGFAGTRTAADTTGFQGIIYPPSAFHYAPGGNLFGKAIGLIPNTDLDGVIKSQVYGGGRVKGFKLDVKRPDDVKIQFDFIGGPWVGTPGQTQTAGASFTQLSPFNSADLICYAGTGIQRTGTGPNFTGISEGTMASFLPDNLTLTYDSNIDDEDIPDGHRGPSKTVAKGAVKVTLEFTIDFTDPASGLSSYDEWVALSSGPRYQNFLLKFTGPDLAGSVSQHHQYYFDLPLMQMEGTPPDRDNSGKTPKMKFKYTQLLDATCKYPLALWTVDKVTAY